jgi:hypothetical protein
MPETAAGPVLTQRVHGRRKWPPTPDGVDDDGSRHTRGRLTQDDDRLRTSAMRMDESSQ